VLSRHAVWLPPMTREALRQSIPAVVALVVVAASGYGLVLSVSTPIYVPVLATLVALSGAIAATLPFVRTMPVWNLIAWDNKRQLPKESTEQQANYEALARALGAIRARDSKRARSALLQVESPSGWASFVVEYLSGEISLLEKTRPETEALRRVIETLDEQYRPTGMAMLAALEGGCEWLEGRDWRAPFADCLTELNIRASIWRGLLPVRLIVILLAAAQLIPWAWWLWGQ
jgi:hypothetical protein